MDGRKDVGILAMDIYFPPTCVLQVTPSISLSAFFLLLISAFFLGEGGGGLRFVLVLWVNHGIVLGGLARCVRRPAWMRWVLGFGAGCGRRQWW